MDRRCARTQPISNFPEEDPPTEIAAYGSITESISFRSRLRSRGRVFAHMDAWLSKRVDSRIALGYRILLGSLCSCFKGPVLGLHCRRKEGTRRKQRGPRWLNGTFSQHCTSADATMPYGEQFYGHGVAMVCRHRWWPVSNWGLPRENHSRSHSTWLLSFALPPSLSPPPSTQFLSRSHWTLTLALQRDPSRSFSLSLMDTHADAEPSARLRVSQRFISFAIFVYSISSLPPRPIFHPRHP